MGLKVLAPLVAGLALATPAQYLQAQQQPDGGFAESGGKTSPALTAWAALGLAAAGQRSQPALGYLQGADVSSLPVATRALVAMAEAALGDGRAAEALPTVAGQTNTMIWTILARRQAGLTVPKHLVNALLARQAKSGGWGWAKGVAPDSNDTAAAVQALRAAGVSGAPRAPRSRLPALGARDGRRLCSRARPRVRRAVDRLGDPGVRRREITRTRGCVRVLDRATTQRWQLPLLAAIRHHARLGDRAGAACRAEAAIPASPGLGVPRFGGWARRRSEPISIG